MKKDLRVLIAGEGHLSFQVYRKLKEKGVNATRVVSDSTEKSLAANGEHSIYEQYQEKFELAGIGTADVVYLIDDEDRFNIQFFLIASKLNPNARLIVSLFNDHLAPHLRSGHKSLEVFNPAAIAAAKFADAALKKPKKSQTQVAGISDVDESSRSPLFTPIIMIAACFFVIVAVSACMFHFEYALSWINALYFTAAVITTTGFGDITLLNAPLATKLFGIVLMFIGVSFSSIAFTLIVEWLLNRRAELALGRKQYTLRDHIILCGLGRLGYQVAYELLRRGYTVLVLESNPDNRFAEHIRASGGHVFIADASLSRNLRRANIAQAKSLLSVIQNDLKNLEIGLIARSIQPSVPLVLRIFDHEIADEMQRRLAIPTALSASTITAEYLLKKL